MKQATLTLLQTCLTKLNEKSSVYGYLMLLAGVFAKQYQGDVAQAAAIISATAGIVLFVLSDAQVRIWLTGIKPTDTPPPTVPPPKEG